MPDIGLSSSYSYAVLLLSLLVAAAISFLTYRRTLPPISAPWRIALASLRGVALFLLFYLLGEPFLSVLRVSSIPPAIAVVLDNSRSMTLSADGDVIGLYEQITSSPEMEELEDVAEIFWYSFDSDLHPLDGWSADALQLDGDRTGITRVFEKMRELPPVQNLQAVLLISDGNSTSGTNPVYAAQALGVAVMTVGVGDTAVRKDVLISDILHNSIAYAGIRVPVQVTVRSSGISEARVEVQLSVRGTIVDRTTLTLGDGASDYRATLHMVADSAGRLRGEVSVTRLDGETTYENNKASFYTTVLSGKRSVLMLAGLPGQDVGFIRRSLEADTNLSVTARVERPDGGFLDGVLTEELVRRSDVLFLIGYPGPFTTERSIRILAAEEVRKKPVFFMPGSRMQPEKLARIADLLPVTIRSILPAEVQVFMNVPEPMGQHSLVRLPQRNAWEGLPPLFRPQGQFSVRPDAEVIATSRLQSQNLADPLLVARSAPGRRSVALLGYGIWRWKMLSPLGGSPDSPFDTFLQNCVQWLTAVQDERRFRVAAARESFSALEPALFRAEVYDERMQPVDDATIDFTITGDGRRYSVLFSSVDNGQYEGSADLLPPGEYAFTASARSGALALGTDQGSFSVGGLQPEFLETRLNSDLLIQLAERTGGAYFRPEKLDGLAERIASLPGFRTTETRSGLEVELAHSAWMLGVIVVLLSLEWFFRKRLGLL